MTSTTLRSGRRWVWSLPDHRPRHLAKPITLEGPLCRRYKLSHGGQLAQARYKRRRDRQRTPTGAGRMVPYGANSTVTVFLSY